MQTLNGEAKAFSTFRVLNGDANRTECDQLFRNMAQLFCYVSDRCEDEQVVQYDDVLCQLSELVEVEARAHVARLLAPLERAPGTVVVKLASDTIEVARPLLEFSRVLSDDDLIEIAMCSSEEHRAAIAARNPVGERVGEAIAEHGEHTSLVRLVRNENARLGTAALERLVKKAAADAEVARDLRGRADVDWETLREAIGSAGAKVLDALAVVKPTSKGAIGQASSMVYQRIVNRAGFSADEWRRSWSQVKAMNDRRQLDEKALARFARFGYGHHLAVGLTVLMQIPPKVFVKWLATQDYVAITVAMRALRIEPGLFESTFSALPWRDLPTSEEIANVRSRFEALSAEEAREIFDMWRAHAFRRREPAAEPMGAA